MTNIILQKDSDTKEKHLKFRDEDNRVVEFRASSGLNYIIQDYES